MDYKRFENLYFYSIDDKVGLADEQNKETLDELQPEEFNEEASTEEDTSIDYSLAYDRMKNKYLDEIHKYKKEKDFINPELEKYREIIAKYEDEKTYKEDFFSALSNFKEEVDALKTKEQHKSENKEARNKASKSFLSAFFQPVWIVLCFLFKGICLLFKGIGYLFAAAFEDDDIGDKTWASYIFCFIPIVVGIVGWVVAIMNHQQLTTLINTFWIYALLLAYSVAAIYFTVKLISEETEHGTLILTISGVIAGILLGVVSYFNVQPDFQITDKIVMVARSKETNTIRFTIGNSTNRDVICLYVEFNIEAKGKKIDNFEGNINPTVLAGSYTDYDIRFQIDGADSEEIANCSLSDLNIEYRITCVTYSDLFTEPDEHYDCEFVPAFILQLEELDI